MILRPLILLALIAATPASAGPWRFSSSGDPTADGEVIVSAREGDQRIAIVCDKQGQEIRVRLAKPVRAPSGRTLAAIGFDQGPMLAEEWQVEDDEIVRAGWRTYFLIEQAIGASRIAVKVGNDTIAFAVEPHDEAFDQFRAACPGLK